MLISNPSNYNGENNKLDMIKNLMGLFEQLVLKEQMEFDKIHKLAIFAVLQTLANIFVEIEAFNMAIKTFKSLKNFCFKWHYTIVN